MRKIITLLLALSLAAVSPAAMGVELYANMSPSLDSPYIGGFAVTKSDSTVLSQPTRAVYVGGTGDMAVRYLDGTTDTLQSIPAGTLLRIRVDKVLSTGTTATKISGLY